MYQRENARRLILLGIAVVVLVLVVGGGYLLLRGGSSSTPPKAAPVVTQPVVVAVQPIPQGTVFRAGTPPVAQYFAIEQVPSTVVPIGAFTDLNQIAALISSSPQQQIVASQNVFQKAVIVSGMFSTLGAYRVSQGAAFAIPYGYVGQAVSFDPINSVLGSIAAGDTIDIIASYHPTTASAQSAAPTSAPAQTQYVMNDVRVISVNAPPAANAQSGGAPAGTPPPAAATPAGGGTLLLLVRYQQALVIQHLKDFGWQISTVLRSAKTADITHFRTLPVTDKWFFVKTTTPMRTNPGY